MISNQNTPKTNKPLKIYNQNTTSNKEVPTTLHQTTTNSPTQYLKNKKSSEKNQVVQPLLKNPK